MLSILIPTFNYNIVPLVKELNAQCIDVDIRFEILAYDDGSSSKFNSDNYQINIIENCIFKELPENIGRSAIRNLLGKDAKYENLLFIDAGTYPRNCDFIKKYISFKDKDVISGGMTCLNKSPKKPYKLRWKYTKKRERSALCSSNFLIKNEAFKSVSFDESIKSYGYEDVLFFASLQQKKIKITRIDNPVVHQVDDDANTFIKKSENALLNLMELNKDKKLINIEISILKYYNLISKIKLKRVIIYLFNWTKVMLVRNFNSNSPSLILFDFYRLGYFCKIISKE